MLRASLMLRACTLKVYSTLSISQLLNNNDYLAGAVFQVVTDNKALQYLDNLKDERSRLTRWALALQPFQFRVIHRAGIANGNADGLSRQFPDPDTLNIKEGGMSGTST